MTTFGPTTRNTPEADQPLVDRDRNWPADLRPARPAGRLAIIAVNDPVPMARAVDARNPLLVSGDGEGVVDAAVWHPQTPTRFCCRVRGSWVDPALPASIEMTPLTVAPTC